MSAIYAGIELGGTKTIWAVGTPLQAPRAWGRITTTEPEPTLREALAAIEASTGADTLAAVGVGAFGPVDVDPRSPTYGTVGNTPKAAWIGADIRALVGRRLEVPVPLDTDVNAAALGELRSGAGVGLSDLVYVTVGTGIGGGAIVGGAVVHGAGHPEMGHMYVPPHHDDVKAGFDGICAYHPGMGCVEGLASGTAIRERYGRAADELPADHAAWPREAHYLALALANLVFSYRPQAIVVGGGVMRAPGLRELVRRALVPLVNPEYLDIGDGTRFALAPGLAERSGVTGALWMAFEAR